MASPTQLTDLNLTTSFARYCAEQFTAAGWLIHWQATTVESGTATLGEVTLVPEFPSDPSVLVLPPRTRKASEILLPAFTIAMVQEPTILTRAGLGEDLFETVAQFAIEGFAVDQSEHMAFATLFRDWFRDGKVLPMFDYETTPAAPTAISDAEVIVESRAINRNYTTDPNVPRQARYYLSALIDVTFFD